MRAGQTCCRPPKPPLACPKICLNKSSNTHNATMAPSLRLVPSPQTISDHGRSHLTLAPYGEHIDDSNISIFERPPASPS